MPSSLRICSLFLAISTAYAAQITVHVGDTPPVTLSDSDLAKLSHQTVKTTEHGVPATYEDVLLHDILAAHGAPLGNNLRGKALSAYVLATGSDGYAVVFSLTEFDPAFQDSDIIVADKRDGKPLDEKQGPLRLVVPHDKKPARSVRMLERIDVVQLRK